MSRSAGKSWFAKAGTFAMLLPFLALAGCANGNEQAMTEKLAAAEAAADKAIAAQHAAEKAAATAAAIQPPPAPEPRVVPDMSDNDDHDNGDDDSGHDDHSVVADEVVVPSQG